MGGHTDGLGRLQGRTGPGCGLGAAVPVLSRDEQTGSARCDVGAEILQCFTCCTSVASAVVDMNARKCWGPNRLHGSKCIGSQRRTAL